MSGLVSEFNSRGTTTIATQIYAKIAAKAASDIAGVGSSSGGLLSLGRPTEITGRPQVDAEVLGGTVAVSIKAGLRYPLNIEQTCEAVRRRVADELREYLGVSSVQVDIDISWLHASGTSAKERLLL